MRLSLAFGLILAFLSCGGPKMEVNMPVGKKMVLGSAAFDSGAVIPVRHSGQGLDLSPELSWDSVPEGTQSFALICEDPDAPGGTFVHWVAYNIPADRRGLPEGIERKPEAGGFLQGANDFGGVGYRGPMPPPGSRHRYFFRLYALDVMLDVEPGLSASELRAAFKGHVLGSAELMGTYSRR